MVAHCTSMDVTLKSHLETFEIIRGVPLGVNVLSLLFIFHQLS